MSVCHQLHSWFGIKITHIFSFILPSTMSAACRSLKRRRASRSGKTLSGVLDSWTLESAANCSARFPRDTISGAQSAKAPSHTFLLFSKFWKFFLSSWWRGIIPVLDIIRAVSDKKIDHKLYFASWPPFHKFLGNMTLCFCSPLYWGNNSGITLLPCCESYFRFPEIVTNVRHHDWTTTFFLTQRRTCFLIGWPYA